MIIEFRKIKDSMMEIIKVMSDNFWDFLFFENKAISRDIKSNKGDPKMAR